MSCANVVVSKATVADIAALEADIACFQGELAARVAERDAAQKRVTSTRGSLRYRLDKLEELKALASAPPPPPPPPTVDLSGPYGFRTAPIGSGGFVTGLDISSDGKRMLHWADVFNGYIRDEGDSQWRFLLRRDNLPAAEYDPKPRTVSTDRGVFAARIAPSNKDRIYVAWNGFIFRSDDGAKSFNRTALPAKLMQSNLGPQRRFNRTIDVHPADPGQVIVGTNNDGVHYTLDGGATWVQVPGLPPTTNTWNGNAGKYLVAFDPGQPSTVYVHVFGTGLYRSTTGLAGAFELVAGSPPEAACLVVQPNGDVWICRFRTSATYYHKPPLYRMDRAGTWTTYDPGFAADQVAINPANSNHIVTMEENGGIKQSLDGGKTWLSHTTYRGSGELQWLSDRKKPMYPAQIMFDPVVPNKLWVAEGVGLCWAIPPAPGEVWTWHNWSQGNEELCSTSVLSSPHDPVPLMTFWDKPIWRLENDTEWKNMWTYPVKPGTVFGEGMVTIGHSIDYALDDPQYLAAVVGMGERLNGFSEDGGRSWKTFEGLPPSGDWILGGCVAVSTRDNIIVTMSNNGPAVYTKDGGKTWNWVSFGGYAPVTHWSNAYYVVRKNICADKTRPGVFACFLNNIIPNVKPDTAGRDIAGAWLSKDGGATWEHRYKGLISPGSNGQFWQARIEFVPGFTGELLYADHEANPWNQLRWSTDDGATWGDVNPRVRMVGAFGFGKAAPGQTRPAVYFKGKVDGVLGVYATHDWFQSFRLLSRFPNESFDDVSAVSGDLHRLGRCYVGFGASGFAIGDLLGV